jgi:hypothetical protein
VDVTGLDVDLTEITLIKNEPALLTFEALGKSLCEAGEQYLQSGKARLPSSLRAQLQTRLREGLASRMVFN